ncbi:MAG: hypothetical protein V2I56_21415 [Desulfobacteraceae bacterium]|jgi:hypothetical protein|nr:hypothetical protein [Desulfobacteraceae bacterium]
MTKKPGFGQRVSGLQYMGLKAKFGTICGVKSLAAGHLFLVSGRWFPVAGSWWLVSGGWLPF